MTGRTRGEMLRAQLTHPGKPRWEVDAEMHRLYVRDGRFNTPYAQWLAELVDPQEPVRDDS